MPNARRRTVRTCVFAASMAVLTAVVVAAPAQAAPVGAVPGDVEATASDAASVPADPAAPSVADPGSPAPVAPDPVVPPEPVVPDPAVPGPGEDDPSSAVAVVATSEGTDVQAGDTVVGQLMQAWPDPTADEHAHEEHGDHEEPLSWIEPADGQAVRVPTDSLPDATVGSTLAVTVGDEITDQASAEQGFEPALAVQSAAVVDAATPDPSTASAGSATTNTVTAVLVLPAGATADGMTIGTVVSALNGSVSSFWDAQSNGTVRIGAVQGAAGWVTSSQSCSSAFALWNDVAAQIGWTAGAGKHLMLYVPPNAPGCSYGLGTVGSSIGSGGRAYVQAAATSVMAHELGHNFGLGHSSELQCDAATESGSCETRSYYDFYDVMGISWGQVGSLNAVQAAKLGLLPSDEMVSLTPSSAATSVTLAPVAASAGTRAVRLTTSAGIVYYLEYRQASGQDSWLGDARNAYGLDSGVLIRKVSSGADTSLLLDGSPSARTAWSSDLQQALPVGRPTSVASGEFTVTVNRIGSTAQVQFGTPAVSTDGPSVPSAPSVPSGGQLASGQSLVSADGAVKVTMQADGNLVSYGTAGRVLWATYSYAPGASLVMQPDGNAVIYASNGRAVWNSGTWGTAGASFVLKADGSSVVVAPSGRELWGTAGDTPSRLQAGQRLTAYQYLVSASGTVKVVMQPDGNLVSYGFGGRVMWSSSTYAPGASLVMQPDGNAVVYAPDGRPIWNTGTWGTGLSALVLKSDGSTVVAGPGGREVWGTVADVPSRLSAGQRLGANQYLVSADSTVKVVMQTDGNLVSYGLGGRVLWATYTYSPGASLVMQPDGNAVVYAADGRLVWHAGTWGNPGSALRIKPDGSSVIATPAGRELWGTSGS